MKLDHIPILEGSNNYLEWSKAMRYTLQGENLWKYIAEGTSRVDVANYGVFPPTVSDSSSEEEFLAAEAFVAADAKACSAIRRRLLPLIEANIPSVCQNSARLTWTHLRDSYYKSDVNALFALRAHVSSLRMRDASDAVRYLGEFNRARERFAAMGISYPDSEAIFQLLSGLPSTGNWGSFAQIIISAVATAHNSGHPLSFDDVRSRLEAEAERVLPFSSSSLYRISEHANPAHEVRKHKNNPSGVPCTNPICIKAGRTYSHDHGHCWQEGGGMAGQKPDWLLQRGKSRSSSYQQSSNAAVSLAIPSSPTFPIDADMSCATADVELSLLSHIGLGALLDSGTTSHLICNKSHFWSFNETLATPVRTANHGILTTQGRGDCVAIVRWNGHCLRLKLRRCLHAPDAVINLISVGAMVGAGFGCNFDHGKVSVTAPFPSGRRVCYERRLEGNLGFLDLEFVPPPSSSIANSATPESSAFARVKVTADLWHARLGHAGGGITRNIGSFATGVTQLPHAVEDVCEACIVGKHPRMPHHSSESPRAANFLQLVHFDLFGPFPVQTPHGKVYGILFLDDHGNNLKIDLLASKDQSLAAFQDCHVHWERKFGRKLVAVRCDNAGEFWSDAFNDYIRKHGIERQRSCPYSHQQNGKAERAIRTIEGRVLAMIAAVGAPMNLWGEAALTAAYLWNRTPSRTLPPGVTPFEMVHGRKPDISHLRVWGSRCFARVPLELQTKLGPRSRECTFMGYPLGVKGYRVRDCALGTFFNSRDVIFDENLPLLQPSSDEDDISSPTSRSSAAPAAVPTSAPATPSVASVPSAPSVAGPSSARASTPAVTPSGPVSLPPAPEALASRSRTLTERGKALRADIQKTKDTRARLVAARKSRAAGSACTLAFCMPSGDVPSPSHLSCACPAAPATPAGPSPSATLQTSLEGVEHVFSDDHANLVCSESAFLSLRSDKARDPTSGSYDLRVPPATFREALQRPDFHVWEDVVSKELTVLKDMHVYSLARLPPGRKAIGNRWVFEHKRDGDDLIPKGRLVAKGFAQIPGIDFGRTFAPVAKSASVRLVAAVACKSGWLLECFDATRAFLWGDLEEELYMKIPDGFVLPSGVSLPAGCDSLSEVVMHLWKSIYGLKQASRVWYIKLRGVLERIGLSRSEADHALFVYNGDWQGEGVHCLLVVHVDDGMAGCNSRTFLDHVKDNILTEFGLKDLGPVRKFLGVEFERSPSTFELWLHQGEYIDTLLADYGLSDCHSAPTPMDATHPFGRDTDDFPNTPDLKTAYQTLMGRLLFLSLFTRPDITLAVNRLAQHNADPLPRHLGSAKRVLRYLKGTRDLWMHFGGMTNDAKGTRLVRHGGIEGLVGFSDSDWAGEEDRVSVSGYSWFYNGCLVDWGSKKQRTVALSSTEAEYMALSLSIQGGLWFRSSLNQARIGHSSPTALNVDNEGAISLTSNASQHGRTKHIDIKYHFIREHISSGAFTILWIPSALNTADIFTKPLPLPLFQSHRDALGLTSR